MMECLLLVLVFAMSDAMAAEKPSRDRHELHMMQMQLQSAQQEKAALADQVDALKKEIETLKADSAGASSKAARAEGARAALLKEMEKQKGEIDALLAKNREAESRILDESKKLQEAGKNLEAIQAEKDGEKKQFEGDLSSKAGEIKSCETKNGALYQLAVALMEKYRNKGVMSSLMQKEPFTGIEEVKIESLLQEYRDKADASRISAQ